MANKTQTKYMGDTQRNTLRNICMIAAERFTENAALFRQIKATGGNPMVTKNGASQLEDQFTRQAEEARILMALFQDGEDFQLDFDPAFFEKQELEQIRRL